LDLMCGTAVADRRICYKRIVGFSPTTQSARPPIVRLDVMGRLLVAYDRSS
jgi:hypothetical protein